MCTRLSFFGLIYICISIIFIIFRISIIKEGISYEYKNVYVFIHLFIYIHTYIYICIYVAINIYTRKYVYECTLNSTYYSFPSLSFSNGLIFFAKSLNCFEKMIDPIYINKCKYTYICTEFEMI
jgi:hypothetical protein